MKALFEQIASKGENSFSTLHIKLPSFEKAYHYHPEFELTYIKKSVGKRFIGGSISVYEPGDLVFVGENVPHCWISEKQLSKNNAEAFVIQFRKYFLGESIWNLPEFSSINKLFLQSNAGIIIKGNAKKKVISIMEDCISSNGADKIIKLIEILNIISNSEEKESIASQIKSLKNSPSENKRFSKIYSYMIANYQNEISLKTISGIANLTPTAFCRFFKNTTHKTFVEVLIDFRINHACQLLRSTEKTILEICNESGFGNLSYFNKKFRLINKVSPLKYRKMFSSLPAV